MSNWVTKIFAGIFIGIHKVYTIIIVILYMVMLIILTLAQRFPSQRRIEEMGEEADLEDVYKIEMQLLYVACTRAREHLLVSGVEPISEFLDEMTI